MLCLPTFNPIRQIPIPLRLLLQTLKTNKLRTPQQHPPSFNFVNLSIRRLNIRYSPIYSKLNDKLNVISIDSRSKILLTFTFDPTNIIILQQIYILWTFSSWVDCSCYFRLSCWFSRRYWYYYLIVCYS